MAEDDWPRGPRKHKRAKVTANTLATIRRTRCPVGLAWLLSALLQCPYAKAAAPPEPHSDVQFALLRYNGGAYNPRPRGLPRLAWELRKRTSIAIALEVQSVDPATEALFDYPLLVWQGDSGFPPLSTAAIHQLRRYRHTGGSLLIDESAGRQNSDFDASVRRELQRIFVDAGLLNESGQPASRLERLSAEHVVYKSFYLVNRHGGRVAVHPYLEGIFVGRRLAVVLSANDLAGAMSRNEFGEWDYDVGPGGAASREMTFRLGINWVMYALCLDYKEDQVHLPFILQRRR